MSGILENHHRTSPLVTNNVHGVDENSKTGANEKILEESDDDANGNREADIRKKQVRSLDQMTFTTILSDSRSSRSSKVDTYSGTLEFILWLPFPLLTVPRLAYQSIGVIYGDIGTSPLYVYSSTFTSEPSYDDLLGALSLIIWTVTLMVSIKYVIIVLQADDEGEGGTFAIYSLLSRYVGFSSAS